MLEGEPTHENLIHPRVGDVIMGSFGGGLPHLVVKVATQSVEAGAIHTYEDGTEEITLTGIILFEQIQQTMDHWDDIDRITEALANNLYHRSERENEVPGIRQFVETIMKSAKNT